MCMAQFKEYAVMMLIPCLLKQFCMFVLKDRGGMLYAGGMNFKCTVETSVPTANKCAVTSLQLLKISDVCLCDPIYGSSCVNKILPLLKFLDSFDPSTPSDANI